jgi:hypothetical protein
MAENGRKEGKNTKRDEKSKKKSERKILGEARMRML